MRIKKKEIFCINLKEVKKQAINYSFIRMHQFIVEVLLKDKVKIDKLP